MKAIAVILVFVGLNAWAVEPPVPTLGRKSQVVPINGLGSDNDTYQIGEEWGKTPVTPDKVSHSEVFQRTARATARVGGATGFYLGKFNGEHVVGTNNHVCPRTTSCRGRISMPMMDKVYRSKGLIGTWPEIDLALVKIEVPEGEDLSSVARNFSFEKALYPGQELLTIGFGVANNRRRQMVMNADSDCKVFSGENEFRFMSDPDALNPGSHKTWSFANGCDVSHGDSGSAMVDRKTGDVVGVIWTGKIPKNARVRNKRYLDEILANQSEDVWQELSYAVPAAKMKEVLLQKLESGQVQGNDAKTLKQILK